MDYHRLALIAVLRFLQFHYLGCDNNSHLSLVPDFKQLWVSFHDVKQHIVYVGLQVHIYILLLTKRFSQLQQL